MNNLDTLPIDVLKLICSNLTHKSILLLNKISIVFNEFIKTNLRSLLIENLSKITRLTLSSYTIKQLLYLYKIPRYNRIIAAHGFSFFIMKNNQVYGCGSNESGKLLGPGSYGYGLVEPSPYDMINVPKLIPNLNDVVQIETMFERSLMLMKDGTLHVFVFNMETLNSQIKPHLRNIIYITTRINQSLDMTNNGQVYVFGYNGNGQLRLGDKLGNSTIIVPYELQDDLTISYATLYRTLTREMFDNNYDEYQRVVKILIKRMYGSSDGELYEATIKTPILNPYLSDIVDISTGMTHTLALTNNGQVYVFGSNEYGQLGLGDHDDRYIPVILPHFTNIINIAVGNY